MMLTAKLVQCGGHRKQRCADGNLNAERVYAHLQGGASLALKPIQISLDFAPHHDLNA